ncbi:MAG: type II secretion system minor pseudopilin GspH [Gammaproteobacteria bacterium]|nr:type II secretion system minor pseudopilin GspH [Gammaproteobacteria bacterium]
MRFRTSGSESGFTLLELLVVVLLIGIVMSFAVLSIGGDSRSVELEREAKRLLALIGYAGEQSVLRTQEWGIRFEDTGYSFMVLNNDNWIDVVNNNTLRARKLPNGVNLKLSIEALEVNMDPGFDLDKDEDEDQLQIKKPMIFILSSGEITPFSVDFRAQETMISFRVIATPLGQLSMERINSNLP